MREYVVNNSNVIDGKMIASICNGNYEVETQKFNVRDVPVLKKLR